VGYSGLLKLLPHREYYWLRNRVKIMRSKGLMPKAEHIGRPIKPVKKEPARREVSTVDRPRPPGFRHDRYMAGESVGCV
jgi:hypothetical protein